MNVLGHAGKVGTAAEVCVKRSALHVTTQRAAMADAARCDAWCTALCLKGENVAVCGGAREAGLRSSLPACGGCKSFRYLIQLVSQSAPFEMTSQHLAF